MPPLVSVLIPYYNDKEYLPKAIEGVLNSSYKNFELILLNHATTDNCREIAHSYKDDRIKHIDLPENYGYGGSGLGMLEFLKIAKGKYIKLLCADDIIRPDGLEILVNYMENNPQKDFAFGDVEYVDIKNKDLNDSWFKSRVGFDINYDEAQCIRKFSQALSIFPYVGSIIKKDIMRTITINTTYVMMFDVSLWVELLCAGYKVGFIDKPVCNYRIHEKQLSSYSMTKKVEYLSRSELTSIWQIYLKIQDVELAKKVWYDSKYVDKLTKKEDIPFFVAYALLETETPYFYAYSYIVNLLNDKTSRMYLQEQFGFGVKQLRTVSMQEYERLIKEGKKKNKFKKIIYQKHIKCLNILDLAFLFIRCIFNIVTLKPIFKYFKDKNRTKNRSL